MNEDARAAELIQKMLRKKLYVLISKPLVPPEQLKPLLATHLDYMIGLEKRGLLFASGPLNEADAPPSGASTARFIRSTSISCSDQLSQ